ncbi:hypothetical protein [Anabaena sp. CCY 9402-a]|uniref:tellurite resistance TerB family protein n=1 Tax=Anabaena sp. CCY 9402-a TaxID=3103867 RepID=UPI0039C656DB
MKTIESIIEGLVYIAVITTAIMVYLNINKVWSRKHEPIVAESVSVGARILAVAFIIPFLMSSLVKLDLGSAANYLLMGVNDGVFLLIGIGVWVKGGKRTSFWRKFFRSLRQEQNEIGNLVKDLTKPTGEEQLLGILHRLAWLDDRLDERERQYIETFAKAWNIDTKDILNYQPPEKGIDKFQYLLQSVTEYLRLEPPKEQVALFGDLVQSLIAADNEITPDEDLIAEELTAMTNQYIGQESGFWFGVIVHPEQDQESTVVAELSAAQEDYSLGDRAFLVGTFHTRRYAEIISQSYRERGWFTFVHDYAVPQSNTSAQKAG